MYALYYSPGTASMAVHLALLEIGVPYELREVDLESGVQKSPEYLKLNPNGVVPTLLVEGEPYYECAALLLLLADRHLDARLSPWPGEPDRALYLQWMVHFANTLQPAFRQWFYPNDFGSPDHEADVKASAQSRIEATWDRLDAHLQRRGPFIGGGRFGIVDIYATMLMRWSRKMQKPATQWSTVAGLAAKVKARPSWKRLYEIERLTEWA